MLVVSCAGDAELAEKIRGYLLAAARMNISLVEDELEISDGDVDREMVNDLLQSYVAGRLEGYSVSEFGDVFVVGIKTDPARFMLHQCEYCR